MPRERLYLFDTTLRDGARFPASSPTELGLARVPHHTAQVGQARLVAGEGWGGGYIACSNFVAPPLPAQLRCADLPLKGGGNVGGRGEHLAHRPAAISIDPVPVRPKRSGRYMSST